MMFKNKYESIKSLLEYLSNVPFDINIKPQQGKTMKPIIT